MTHPSNIPFHDFRFSAGDPIPFEIIRSERLMKPARMDFSKPNRVNFYEIVWVLSGSGTRTIDFKSYPVHPNCVFCLTPGQVHYSQLDEPVSGFVVLFLEEFLSLDPVDERLLRRLDYFHHIDRDPVITVDDHEAGFLRATVDGMLNEYERRQPGRTIAIQSLLRYFLIQLQRSYQASHLPSPPSSELFLIDQFQQLIDQHFLAKHSVRDYAEMLGITAGYLTTLAKNTTGLSAGALIHRRIILEAERLLVHTDCTVSEIGYDLHFGDSSYFARFFRRETGQSPTAFREDFRRKYQASQI